MGRVRGLCEVSATVRASRVRTAGEVGGSTDDAFWKVSTTAYRSNLILKNGSEAVLLVLNQTEQPLYQIHIVVRSLRKRLQEAAIAWSRRF